MSDDFYQRLNAREIEERNARIFRDCPDNLHDYQGCAKDAEVCKCGHTRRCHLGEGCDDGCPCVTFEAEPSQPEAAVSEGKEATTIFATTGVVPTTCGSSFILDAAMSDLEQRIKEEAVNRFYVKSYDVLALLAEKDAEIERLKAELKKRKAPLTWEQYEAERVLAFRERALTAEAALESLKRDLESTDEALEAQVIKYENCPHEMVVGVTCACSHDAPSDVCSVHAPQLRKAQEEVESLKARAELACDQLNAAMIGQCERQAQFERMSNLCDQAIEQRDAAERIAGMYHADHQDLSKDGKHWATCKCDICKAYDALSGPREGEQDAVD